MKRTIRKVQLPIDFAQRLLDNQIEFKLAELPSKQVISNLIQLYTYGVQYYEAIKSHKYLYFQAKMKQLFNAKTPLQIMNKKELPQENSTQSPIQKKMKSKKQEEKIQAFKIKQKQQKMLHQIVERTSYSATSSQTKNILKQSQNQQIQVHKVIYEQLENQNRTLQQKLQQRKVRKMFAKSLSSIELFQTPTRQSLFDHESPIENRPQAFESPIRKKPIKVNFQSFIHEDDESEEAEDEPIRRRKKSLFNSVRVEAIEKSPEMTEEELSTVMENVDFSATN